MKYSNIIEELLMRFPDYASSEEIEGYEKDLPHLVYSGFGRYFRRIVNESTEPVKDSKIMDICKFLDEMANSDDKKVIDLLITGFFESVTNEKKEITQKPLTALNSLLGKNAKKLLKELIEWKPPIPINRFLLEDEEGEK